MTVRRTKIVATLGPASNSPEVIEQLIKAGLDVARLNFSHGTPDEHKARARLIREIAARLGRHVALLGDLQGPKIRIAKFTNKRIELKVGDRFTFSTSHPLTDGNQEVVGIDYPDLVKDCGVGDELLLDDGRVVMRVETATADSLHCSVLIGGPLSDHKGINRRGGGLTAPALTEKDKADIKLAAEMDLDYLAVSFPRDASDMEYARQLRDESGGTAWLVAKIERAEAVADDETLDGLIRASDAVMVARGDLGVEIGDAELIGIQKKIIQHARRNNKAVIVATQMMESMIQNPMPTRAEVSDVANAVLDYTDAVMLSAESAAGSYPIEAVQAMARIIVGAEKHPTSKKSSHRLYTQFQRCDESIALAAMYTANHFPGVKAIIALTETGYTSLIMSRLRSSVPIFAFSPQRATQARAAMFRGVYPVDFDPAVLPPSEVSKAAIDKLLEMGIVQQGDWVILTKGDSYAQTGGTNGMKILHVGDPLVD
ncbi:Pyruvate kinase II [Pseudomonas sp. MM227]|uniref:Pyruvate kinase n=1 Tax=Pseudomonas baltica TaxID=2762576 RepID=A0A7X1G5V0_9PSED|nr:MULTISPECIES: pyruvate kinase [Pseudomonas]MBC2678264.1 pyruvate kinase [Pseudomonas baltica]MBD8592877.1 pyruvate kinase [Pseudomonas sp. CFBP 8758]MBD8602130.1 pyruvate kinase [Pseudomonas sp. CFBP 8771]MBD8622364.1 pyruvate kinase [Pseudomonas sp. CFBP 13727]MBD8730831.1 pyruvate kinase [Pseudomonas sp. CFBP 13710]